MGTGPTCELGQLEAGEHTIKLRVDDERGGVDECSLTITVGEWKVPEEHSSGVIITYPDGTTKSPFMGTQDVVEGMKFTFLGNPDSYVILPGTGTLIYSDGTKDTVTLTEWRTRIAEHSQEQEIKINKDKSNIPLTITYTWASEGKTMCDEYQIRSGELIMAEELVLKGGEYIRKNWVSIAGGTVIRILTGVPGFLVTTPTKYISRALGEQYEFFGMTEEERMGWEIEHPPTPFNIMGPDGLPHTVVLPFYTDF